MSSVKKLHTHCKIIGSHGCTEDLNCNVVITETATKITIFTTALACFEFQRWATS